MILCAIKILKLKQLFKVSVHGSSFFLPYIHVYVHIMAKLGIFLYEANSLLHSSTLRTSQIHYKWSMNKSLGKMRG